MDAICKPLAPAICTSDIHTLWEGALKLPRRVQKQSGAQRDGA